MTGTLNPIAAAGSLTTTPGKFVAAYFIRRLQRQARAVNLAPTVGSLTPTVGSLASTGNGIAARIKRVIGRCNVLGSLEERESWRENVVT